MKFKVGDYIILKTTTSGLDPHKSDTYNTFLWEKWLGKFAKEYLDLLLELKKVRKVYVANGKYATIIRAGWHTPTIRPEDPNCGVYLVRTDDGEYSIVNERGIQLA